MIAIIATVLVAGIIGVVVVSYAQTGSATTPKNTIMARVAQILGIDQTKLENAFAQAKREQQVQALDTYLKNMVSQGKITPQQADQYKQWWQSRPNLPAGMSGNGSRMRPGMRGGLRQCLPPLTPTATPQAK